ncbi:MAG TPA: ADP-ribosylglycohydrolase family protein [Trueperaceae bacterium]
MEPGEGKLDRARGCLVGQVAGDSLGGLVEFGTPADVAARYPGGVRELQDGGHWGTLAGQPTDDSEMALALARTLVGGREYDPGAARAAYVAWLDSGPFDYGITVRAGLRGAPDAASQANGALMRVSPLGVFGAGRDDATVAGWAEADAAITHPHRVCRQANALFALAVAHAVEEGPAPAELYGRVRRWSAEMAVDPALRRAVDAAASEPPADFTTLMGWVLIAFQNALYQLVNAASLEEALVDTVGRGGDTDTNAAIAGALLGAVHGLGAVPRRWTDAVLACRPEAGRPGVRRPRPREYWPVDVLELAEALLAR